MNHKIFQAIALSIVPVVSSPAIAAVATPHCELTDESAKELISKVKTESEIQLTHHNRRFTHFKNADVSIEEISMLYGPPYIVESETVSRTTEYSWSTPQWIKKTSSDTFYELGHKKNCINIFQVHMFGHLIMTVSSDGKILNKKTYTEQSS